MSQTGLKHNKDTYWLRQNFEANASNFLFFNVY